MKNLNTLFFGLLICTQSFSGETLKLQSGNFKLPDFQTNYQTHRLHQTTTSADSPKYYVIQFQNVISDSDLKALDDLSIESKRYIPDDALLVRASLAQLEDFSVRSPNFKTFVAYQAAWKVSPETQAHSLSSDSSSKEIYIVTLFSSESLKEKANLVESIPNTKVLTSEGKDILVYTEPSTVEILSRIQGVEWIQKAPLFQTFDFIPEANALTPLSFEETKPELTGFESGTKIMNFDAAWKKGFTGKGVTVAVCDTGIDSGIVGKLHPDLNENLVQGFATGVGGRNWKDEHGHGTHVSGSVAGDGAKSSGKIRGGAFDSKLIAMGLWTSALGTPTIVPPTDMSKLIEPGRKAGARVHTNSWGGTTNFGAYDTFANKVDEYMWEKQDMTVLFAAGNNGIDQNRDGLIDESSISSPGTAKNVITVGASENVLHQGGIQKTLRELNGGSSKWGVDPVGSDKLSNHADGLAAFSSRGPTKDGRLKPEVVAPGTNIVSTQSQVPGAGKLWGAYDEYYSYAGGTSMATPLTAGAVAVGIQYLQEVQKIKYPTSAMMKAYLVHSAKDMFPGQFGFRSKGQELATKRPNVHEGYGRVDLDRATNFSKEDQFYQTLSGVKTGEDEVVATITLGRSTKSEKKWWQFWKKDEKNPKTNSYKNIQATLAYTDAPGAMTAAKALVNDIDLVIRDSKGKEFSNKDRVNNLEMLELENLPEGDYEIIIRGINVPKGKSNRQPFAVIVSAR